MYNEATIYNQSDKSYIPSDASATNKLVTKADLDEATAAWDAGYTPKGPASVSTLNGLSGQENGDRYVLTNGGTLSAGSLVVVAGDEVAWDGTGEKWYKVSLFALKKFSGIFIKKRWQTSSKHIYVCIPSQSGYVMFDISFVENLDESKNYSLWRLQWVYAGDENLNILDYLSVSGEWECALKLKDADDFMGGSTHGDEIMSNVCWIVDGQEVDMATWSGGFCHELRMARKSTMYDPRDHVTQTAEHGVEYVFDSEGLTMSQSVKWLVNAEVTNCYMGMNLPKKAYTTKGYIDTVFDPSTLPAYTRYPDASKLVLFDSEKGTFCSFENLELTKTEDAGNNSLYFTDNSGNNYNKGYFCATYTSEGVVIPANTLWKSKTRYIYKTAKAITV